MTTRDALLPLAAAASVAAARPEAPTGSNIAGGQTSSPVHQVGNATDWSDVAPIAKTRKVVRKFAQCVVARHTKQSSTVILEDLSNSEIIRNYPVLRDSNCALNAEKTYQGVSLDFPGDTFRYVIAEALVNAEMPQVLTAVSSAPPLKKRVHDPARFVPKSKRPNAKMLQTSQQASQLDEAQIFALELAECTVRKDPIASYRLLFTEPASQEEDAAVAALTPALGHCAPAGQKLAVDIVMVRGAIAVSYYRLARAVTGPPEVRHQ